MRSAAMATGGDGHVHARRIIALQYAARIPPKHQRFYWPSNGELIDIQDQLYGDLALGSDGCHAYKHSFLKELVQRLEDAMHGLQDGAEAELSDALLEEYVNVMAHPASASTMPQTHIVTRYFPSAAPTQGSGILDGLVPIRTSEEAATITRGTTGLKTWEASLRLAAHLVANPDLLRGRQTVLELGCGTGFISIVGAAILSTSDPRAAESTRFVLSDLDGQVLEKAQLTLELNAEAIGSRCTLGVVPLDWIDIQHDETQPCAWLDDLRPDLVLAADVVFDPLLIAPLCAVLRRILLGSRAKERQAPVVLIASTVRNATTFQLFTDTLESLSLSVQECPLSRPILDAESLKMADSSPVHGTNSAAHQIPLFPSAHSPGVDGRVVLLRVRANTDPV